MRLATGNDIERRSGVALIPATALSGRHCQHWRPTRASRSRLSVRQPAFGHMRRFFAPETAFDWLKYIFVAHDARFLKLYICGYFAWRRICKVRDKI